MADLLQQGSAWLTGVFRERVSQAVTYKRNDAEAGLPATIGTTELKHTTGDQLELRKKWRDYLIAVADLAENEFGAPRRGDLVLEGDRTYQVVSLPGGGTHYEIDAAGLVYRIHTQLIDDGT